MSEFNKQSGGINVKTEHIFPVIKKWLYSEKDIFLREIVSNASDAITKLRRLSSLGEISLTEEALSSFRIDVFLDKDAGTLTVKDNGIGMTEEELTKYLCNIALSGALDFIAKYEGENENESGIIGHFGLGFYSSFMVSEKVEVITRSYTGAPAVRWVCNESGEYELFSADTEETGTTVIMHVSDAEKEYLNSEKIRSILNKYCSFMPVDVYFSDGTEEKNEESESEPLPINDTTPLWLKAPSECTEEEYNAFYHKVFGDFRDPLFYIHINADYPLNFKGILYFPRIENEYQSIEGQVKLYYNQVFVADNIKEVIPDYLLMLKGVLDCPQLPLNVSRSYLQTNTYVSKVSSHIVKKVADKLNFLCSKDREKYESVFDSIKTFVEYACIRDRKFYDRVKGSILFPLCNGEHKTLSEYLEQVKEAGAENKMFYATDKEIQSQYISIFTAKGMPVIFLPHIIDTQFISTLEQYGESFSFMRVDADSTELFGKEDGDTEELTKLFRNISKNEKLAVSLASLPNSDMPAILNVSEESRRFSDMMKMYSMGGVMPDMPIDTTLVLNTASPLYQKLTSDSNDKEYLAGYIYRLALLSHRKLTAEEMDLFVKESVALLKKL